MRILFQVTWIAMLGLVLAGCGIVTSLPSTSYAEIRLGEAGKSQLLIETDQWRGVVTAEGYQGNRHRTQAWFFLQGDGPVYHVNQTVGVGESAVGEIVIDRERKLVKLNLRDVESDRGTQEQYRYNGTYHLASISHQPFFTNAIGSR